MPIHSLRVALDWFRRRSRLRDKEAYCTKLARRGGKAGNEVIRAMILRNWMGERKGKRNWRLLVAAAVITEALLAAGSAEERRVLSAVTPDTLAKGETVKVRWNYDDGNGGERRYLFNLRDEYWCLDHFYSVWNN